MTTTYWYAPEIEKIAKPLIEKYHRHLMGLDPSELRYCFRSTAARKGGRLKLGTATKVTGRAAFLGDTCAPTIETEEVPRPFFLITIAADLFENLNEHQRKALVDHELEHCAIEVSDEGTPVFVIKPHDVEEFSSIVVRWGLWAPDVADFMIRGVNAHPTLFDLADPNTGEVRPARAFIVGEPEGPVEHTPLSAPAGPVPVPDGADADPLATAIAVDPDAVSEEEASEAAVTNLRRLGDEVAAARARRAGPSPEDLGISVVDTTVDTTEDPAATVALKVPHELSALAGQPCESDTYGAFSHEDCNYQEETNAQQ